MVDAVDLDKAVAAFETAWESGPPTISDYLPIGNHTARRLVLAELVRVDLEFRQRHGEPARLDRYRDDYPELFTDRATVRELAFEEYRLRVAAGESVHPRDYAAKFGIDTAGWPISHGSSGPRTDAIPAVTPGAVAFPEPGETVAGFAVVSELGRGAFGRVYLAEQVGLSGRRVAVKLSTRFGTAEPETLARLQHTHIVPVYSTHQYGRFQLVVMPYLGAATLADLLRDLHSRSAWPESGKELADTLAQRRSRTQPASEAVGSTDTYPPPAVPRADIASRTLSRFNFPNAVLWIGARLAEALAHAHERGVLHRDVKPANVLLTDDGVPMLLDFNLATDAGCNRPSLGGTPAYMSPEQLRVLRGKHITADGRADVFSLGIVLFELLTGRHPFPWPAKGEGNSADVLLPLRSAAPSVRSVNPAVSPSTEAILRRCLEPDPTRRYQSARQLSEDLDRQIADLPLRHTREPSPRERFRKWRRRHPRLTSSGSVAVFAAVVVVGLAGLVAARTERLKRVEAEQAEAGRRVDAAEKYQTFRTDAKEALRLLAIYGHDPRKAEDGERRVRAGLARYAVVEDPDWATRPAVRLLPEADQFALRHQSAELLSLLARVRSDRARATSPGPARDAALAEALALLDRSANSYGEDAVPLATRLEREEVLARLGRPPQPPGDGLKGAVVAAREAYLAGTAALGRGKYKDAVHLLERATDQDPRQFWAWFGLGVAQLGLGRDAQAEGCFNACLALEPDHPMSYFNRGLSRLNRKLFHPAELDFSAALRLDPKLTDALVNRALARVGMARHADAENDLTKALALGAPETRILFLRADVRDRLGNRAGGAADRTAGLAAKPADEASWVARGLARSGPDPKSSLADFDAALALNPRSFPALQNKAFVLAEKLNRQAEAVTVLGVALDHYPDSHLARAGRAVLLARSGDRPAAHADSDRCQSQGPTADIVYQLAGVYALTSKTHPEDARIALRLLSEALKQGYGFELLAIDTDLDPIRKSSEFRALVEAARAVAPVGKE